LFDRLAATGSQVWITGTERAPFDDIGAASWFVVADGSVSAA
jgi:DNA replication and repair protein RecF